MGLALLAGTAQAQPGTSALARPVRTNPAETTLAQALAELSRQSGVPFSYSSTRIGAGRRCRLRGGTPKPLGTALNELLGPRNLSYGLLNGQLVLWPSAELAPAGVTELNSLGQPPAMDRQPKSVANRSVENTGVGATASATRAARLTSPSEGTRRAVMKSVSGRGTSPVAKAGESLSWAGAQRPAAGSLRSVESRTGRPGNSPAGPGASGSLPKAVNQVGSRAFASAADSKTVEAAVSVLQPRRVVGIAANEVPPATLPLGPAPDPVEPARVALKRRTGQVSFVAPLGSNWLASPRTVNDFSLNVLAGYSAGVRKLELGGVLNVVRDTVRGVQAAGIANVTGTDVRGVQLAGVVNLVGGSVRGVQGAGTINIVRDDARGLQVAGLANISGGAALARKRPGQPTRLRRWLGLPRLLATDALGQLPAAPSTSQPGVLVQAAAITNITGTDVRGVQTSAILNVARRVKGVQLGLINVGHHVSGTQIGLINYADSVDGASIGIINIVRHGYLHGEVWASECLPLNAVVKLGVQRYYTLLGLASEPFGNRVQWASGFGIGTAGRPHGRVTFSVDIIHWALAGSTSDVDAENIDSRQLTQLRPALAWQIEPQGRLQLVVAPTLNLAIAWSNDHQPQWDFGANQKLWIDTAGEQSRTRLWPGAQIGLRF